MKDIYGFLESVGAPIPPAERKVKRLRQSHFNSPSRVIKLHNGNWFGLCYMCGMHMHSLKWETAFSRMFNHVTRSHTYTLES